MLLMHHVYPCFGHSHKVQPLTGASFAGAFTWLNRHDDSSAAGQDGFRQGGTGTQSTRQQSGKSEQPNAQRQARQGAEPQPLQSQAEQERIDRAFKSTDSRWKSDRAYWKFPRPAASSSYMPQRVSEASAGTSEANTRVRGATGRASTFRCAAAQSSLSSNAQQHVLPEPTESSQKQAPRLRICFGIQNITSQHLAHTLSAACQKSAAQHFAVCGAEVRLTAKRCISWELGDLRWCKI